LASTLISILIKQSNLGKGEIMAKNINSETGNNNPVEGEK